MSSRSETFSICIVAQNAYRALTGRGSGHIGGVERQTALMANWLAGRGHQVSVLVWTPEDGDLSAPNNIRLIGICRKDAGVPVLRFFYPRLSGLWRALGQANADIYYHNSAEYVTGVVAAWAKSHGRQFVYSVASDADVDTSLPELKQWRERLLYRWGLKRAGRIFVQTEKQEKALAEGFGLKGDRLPMPCPGARADLLAQANEEQPAPIQPLRVAWVGRLDPVKRLDFLLEVAAQVPEAQFEIAAANMNESDYSRNLYQRGKELKNVNWLGGVPYEKIGEVYHRSSCLCCTSIYEGFPNTFLEAWSYGRPVVSTFDPDRLIQRRNLGTVALQPAEMSAALRELASQPAAWREKSENARRYFEENHRLEAAMPRFETHFRNLLAK